MSLDAKKSVERAAPCFGPHLRPVVKMKRDDGVVGRLRLNASSRHLTGEKPDMVEDRVKIIGVKRGVVGKRTFVVE